jgi:preprotein translocase SecE subunit
MAVVDKFRDTKTFLEESWIELQKVTWPDWDQLKNATMIVIFFTIAISFVIWLMDAAVRITLDFVMGIFGA